MIRTFGLNKSAMTVEQLISSLSEHPSDALVCLNYCNIESFDIVSVKPGIGEGGDDKIIPLVVINITKE